MPVPVSVNAQTTKVNGPKPPAKKKRVVRRRGRAPHAVDSDDEIEREVGTDSDSDNDSIVSSASEADADQSRRIDPGTSQSPATVPSGRSKGRDSSFFATGPSWSDMVADEAATGTADLPVIDFAQLNDRTSSAKAPPPSRKSKKAIAKTKPAASLPSPPLSVTEEHEEEHVQLSEEQALNQPPPRPARDFVRRPPGQTARQAYQTRLESDPSYVPTVGEFWGHDDRLIDKDLRSLSGWWRGRWQGRGRGRGSFPMRGRGGFMGRIIQEPADDPSLPPVEREWTHDGFEELKRNEEGRREQQHATRGGWGFRGRGAGFVRGRGSFAGSPARSTTTLPSGRIWYPTKPELAWTKQQEGFLYIDSNLRARRGRVAGVRVRLPGSRAHIVRTPFTTSKDFPVVNPAATSARSVGGSDYGDKPVVVRLPSKEASKPPATRTGPSESITTKVDELTLEEVFTVRPQLVTTKPIPLPEFPLSVQSAAPSAVVQQRLEQLSIATESDEVLRSETVEAVLKNPTDYTSPEPTASSSTSEPRPALASLQTSFTPPAQPSPYMSPYQYSIPLPPGIAMNPLGMPFEVTTGRPVYLQAPPSYMLPAPFVPGQMQHSSSISGDFVPSPPLMNGGYADPSTSMPLFSYPQPARVEIRAPGSQPNRPTRAPSGLRSSAVAFTPTAASGGEQQQAEGPPGADDSYSAPEGEESQEGTMYLPYGQYYYPDGYGGYMPYMDMSQMPQYEMYPTQETIPHGTVYY